MTDVVSADDLTFAYLRAKWLDSPQQVAADLLAAAAQPELCDGVSALQVRITAGNVLADYGNRADGIDILRGAVAGSRPGADGDARLFLATVLAQAGEVAEAEAVAAESIAAVAAGPEAPIAFSQYMFVANGFAQAGLADLAMRWADKGMAAAAAVRGSRSLRFRAGQFAAAMREGVQARLKAAEESGPRDGGSPSLPDPPWPAVTNGRLLWWPEVQYGRLVRQVPALAEILGRAWPDHTRLVESVLREHTRWSPGEPVGQVIQPVAGDFDRFASFLLSKGADPRDRAAMTAYGLADQAASASWPPKPRKPCWCGSGRSYGQCCGIQTGA